MSDSRFGNPCVSPVSPVVKDFEVQHRGTPGIRDLQYYRPPKDALYMASIKSCDCPS
jgi:hypothetical protein